MLRIFLMISTLAICQGDMLCMLNKYGDCSATSTSVSKGNSYCVEASRKYDCWKTKAKDCDVEDTEVIKNLLADYNDVCLDNGWNNKFKAHEACVYELYESTQMQAAGPCNFIIQGMQQVQAISGLGGICETLDRTYDCLRRKVRELCGREADYVFCKLLGSRQKLVDEACAEVGVVNNATLDSSWCMYSGAKTIGCNVVYSLVQVIAVVLSFRLLNM